MKTVRIPTIFHIYSTDDARNDIHSGECTTFIAMEMGTASPPKYPCESELALRRWTTNRDTHDDKRVCADHALDRSFVLRHDSDASTGVVNIRGLVQFSFDSDSDSD
jgi:hypothetical protein